MHKAHCSNDRTLAATKIKHERVTSFARQGILEPPLHFDCLPANETVV